MLRAYLSYFFLFSPGSLIFAPFIYSWLTRDWHLFDFFCRLLCVKSKLKCDLRCGCVCARVCVLLFDFALFCCSQKLFICGKLRTWLWPAAPWPRAALLRRSPRWPRSSRRPNWLIKQTSNAHNGHASSWQPPQTQDPDLETENGERRT